MLGNDLARLYYERMTSVDMVAWSRLGFVSVRGYRMEFLSALPPKTYRTAGASLWRRRSLGDSRSLSLAQPLLLKPSGSLKSTSVQSRIFGCYRVVGVRWRPVKIRLA